MLLKKTGKTKDVYDLGDGTYLLKFKDDATGENGVFDPGANTVGLTIDGLGRAGLRMSTRFFRLIEEQGVKTHFVSADVDGGAMVVRPAEPFGQGVEVICRLRAVGSFLRRYGAYVKEGQKLDALVEVTLKDDAGGDPLIVPEALAQLGIMTVEEYDTLSAMTKRIAGIIADELAAKGLELYDLKLEYGRGANGELLLIDEISAGNMRAYGKDGIVGPMELAGLFA